MADEASAAPQGRIRTYAQSKYVAAAMAIQSGSGKHEPKISTSEIVIIGLYALALDIADWFVVPGEFFITDALGLLIDLYLCMKGLPLGRMLIMQATELIPGVEEFDPGYTIGWILTVYLDRHPKTATVANVASTLTGKPGATSVAAVAKGAAGKAEKLAVSGPVRTLATKEAGSIGAQAEQTAAKGVGAAEGAAEKEKVGFVGRQRDKLYEKDTKRRGERAGGGPAAGGEGYAPEEEGSDDANLFQLQEPSAPKPYRTPGEGAEGRSAEQGAPSDSSKMEPQESTGGSTAPPSPYKEEGVYTPPDTSRHGEDQFPESAPAQPSEESGKSPESTPTPEPAYEEIVGTASEPVQTDTSQTSASEPSTSASEKVSFAPPSAGAPPIGVSTAAISQESVVRRQQKRQEAAPPQPKPEKTDEYMDMLFRSPVTDEITDEMKESALSGESLRQVVEESRKEAAPTPAPRPERKSAPVNLRPVVDRTGEPSAASPPTPSSAPVTDTPSPEQKNTVIQMPPQKNTPDTATPQPRDMDDLPKAA